MPVFSRFDPTKAGDVNANAHPNVYVYPWIPSQQNVRSNPLPASAFGNAGKSNVATGGKANYGTRTQRVQPNEKKAWFTTRGFSLTASSPAREGSCPCSAGGKGGVAHASGDRS